jgi:hypothetical protein
LVALGVSACGAGGGSPVAGQLRIALTSDGSGAASARAMATDSATARVIADQKFPFQGQVATVMLTLPASRIRLDLRVFADADEATELAKSEIDVDVDASDRVDVDAKVHISTGGEGDDMKVTVDHVPVIDSLDVQIQPALKLGALETALVTVRAHDADGDALRYFWSGVGLSGTVEGQASMALSIAGPPQKGGPVLNVVVQDPAGEAARAKVVFTPNGIGVLRDGFHVIILGAQEQENDVCLDTHEKCVTACDAQAAASDASVHAACQGQCGMALAECLTG